jgi:tetratricopeptide (TPR) repeat protein
MTENVMSMRLVATALALLLSAGSAIAEQCPDTIAEDALVRRQQAKRWFTTGEAASKAGDDLAALKAYQCSARFVPHGFTAFNIGQIAERVGDLELAVASYNQYLLLMPDAHDAIEVRAKIASLKERLVQVKAQEQAAREPKPAAKPLVPVAEPEEGPGQGVGAVSTPSSGSTYRTWAWVSYGAGAAAIIGGVITNLMSRSKMDTCRTKYSQDDRIGADAACSDATPLAYTSYILFGVGGAALAAGTALLALRPTESTEVAMAPLPNGGMSLRWGGRF